jgi:DNA-binding transcriptional MerR regulator
VVTLAIEANPESTTNPVDIGEVIERTGLPASTLHLWERRGLIASRGRIGLRRQYQPDIFDRLAFIVLCQRGHFTLDTIVELIADMEVGKKGRLEEQLDRLVVQRSQLDAAIASLEHAIHCPEPLPYECPGLQAKLAGTFTRVADDT